jgi:hypothetical protein
MGQAIEVVLTRTQDNRRKQAILSALIELVNAPEMMDLIQAIPLGHYPNYTQRGDWGRLELTKDGLVERTGFYDKCMMPSDCDGLHRDIENDPRRVEPCERLVQEYKLEETTLKEILMKLQS